jgi:hypothetical protein
MLSKEISRVVGIALGDAHFSFVQVARVPSGIEIFKAGTVPFKVNPATDPPEITGKEIHRILSESGVRARHCLVCIPTAWLLTMPVELPAALSGDDLQDYLKIQAEQEFCFSAGESALALSRTPGTERGTLAATSLARVRRVQEICQFARLKIVGLAPSIALVKGAASAAILMSDLGTDLGVGTDSTMEAMRVLVPGNPLSGMDESGLGAMVRELKIALGGKTSTDPPLDLALYGYGSTLDELRETLEEELPGLACNCPPIPSGLVVGTEAAVLQLPAYNAAKLFLEKAPLPFAFENALKSKNGFAFNGAAGLKRYRNVAVAAVAAVLLIVGTYFGQWANLLRLRGACGELQPGAVKVETMRREAKELGAWYETQATSLDLLRIITEAFPETGTVWLNNMSVDSEMNLRLNGKATSRQAWLTMHDKLLKTPGVRELRIQQTRADAKNGEALSFSLNFTYHPEG